MNLLNLGLNRGYKQKRGEEMKHYRGFEAKVLSTTDTKGTRIRVKDLRRNESKIIHWNYEYSNMRDQVEDYLKTKNIYCQGFVGTDTTDILFSSDFERGLND